MSRQSGVVKWFSNEKGYGFLKHAGGDDVFVHHRDIEGNGFKTLRAGESVEFEIRPTERGLKAHNVIRLGMERSGSRGAAETLDERAAKQASSWTSRLLARFRR